MNGKPPNNTQEQGRNMERTEHRNGIQGTEHIMIGKHHFTSILRFIRRSQCILGDDIVDFRFELGVESRGVGTCRCCPNLNSRNKKKKMSRQ